MRSPVQCQCHINGGGELLSTSENSTFSGSSSSAVGFSNSSSAMCAAPPNLREGPSEAAVPRGVVVGGLGAGRVDRARAVPRLWQIW
jgi:hypothetical protein